MVAVSRKSETQYLRPNCGDVGEGTELLIPISDCAFPIVEGCPAARGLVEASHCQGHVQVEQIALKIQRFHVVCSMAEDAAIVTAQRECHYPCS